jgi:hypothetical protein
MKRTLALLALLVILVAAYFLFVYQSVPDNVFHIADLTEVGTVELQTVAKGEKKEILRLERSEDEWKVNGQYNAITSKVDDFLLLLTQIRVANKIDEKGQESALALLKRNHTKVTIKDRDGSEIKSYLVGATTNQQTTNIMMIEGATKAYLVARPGTEGYISIYYSTNADTWREKLLFELQGDNLQEVNLVYRDSLQGFRLRRTGGNAPWTIAEGVYADEDRVKSYLELFDGKVFGESFAGSTFPGMRDSLARRAPDALLYFATLKGESGALKLYARPENLNNFFGYMEGSLELFIIQHYVIDKFLKTGDYFQKSGI